MIVVDVCNKVDQEDTVLMTVSATAVDVIVVDLAKASMSV